MRLDRALVERGLARSRSQAAKAIADGLVQVDGVTVRKPALPVTPETQIEARQQTWVSRAATKLLGALTESGTHVTGRVLDAGASTGGFTQVCLASGAELVYAVDVGHSQLAEEIRSDPRVVVREGLNVRDITLADVEQQPVDLLVADLSFISLQLVLGPLLALLRPDGVALLLVKPQFEVGRERLGSGGIVADPADRAAAVAEVIDAAAKLGWRCDWQGQSSLPGTHGNVEFFVRLRPTSDSSVSKVG